MLPDPQSGIRQLHARYVDAVWRKDAVALAQCYVIDGEWQVAGRFLQGREQIAVAFLDFVEKLDRVHMRTCMSTLEVGDDEARGRVRITELVRSVNGGTTLNIGFYHDHYVTSGGVWLYRRRAWTLAYKGLLGEPAVDAAE